MVFEQFGGGTPPVHPENRNSHEQPLRSASAATVRRREGRGEKRFTGVGDFGVQVA